jgi:hypothetical protein
MDQKSRQFVQRLLANPALKPLTPLQKEEQIISFLRQNSRQLYPTLSSPAFFPGSTWNTIFQNMVEELYAVTAESISAGLKEFFSRTINFHFTSFFSRSQGMNGEKTGELYAYMMKMLSHPLARRGLTGPYTAITLRLAHRYLDLVYDGRGYIRFELEKVQRLAMSQEEVKNMVRTSMLLRPAVLLFQTSGVQGMDMTRGLVPYQFALRVRESLEKELPFLPRELIESAVFSNVSFVECSDIPATSRLAALFSFMARDYRPGMKIDRGAASQERSWFGVARSNHRHFGFDMKMVDELYRLAAENGW